MIGVDDQEGRLAAVAISALEGPLVRVCEVELIGRVPSEVRTEIRGLASGQGVAVEVNRSGDPEITAWGLSMGAEQEWERPPEGRDRDERVLELLPSMATSSRSRVLERAGGPQADESGREVTDLVPDLDRTLTVPTGRHGLTQPRSTARQPQLKQRGQWRPRADRGPHASAISKPA
ncbi:hypothetical protein ACFVQ4_15740 [Streptomyces laurentii]|uniref:hypothetical protein n=1 Tax=Streptomyces laurentii TaxID=39478 RepID=UPI0036CE3C1F